MDIDKLIKVEINFFSKIKKISKKISNEDLANFRTETIQQRRERISLELYSLCSETIQYGPFKGLKLDNDNWWGASDIGTQCLGLYEYELLNFIENINENQYSNFINIGAADGYYAIGFLFSKKVKRSICFEQSKVGQETILKNWEKNDRPGQIFIYDKAEPNSFTKKIEKYLEEDSLFLIDIEGNEFNLLNKAVLSKLSNSLIIIEIHNWVDNFEDKYIKLLSDANEFFTIEIIESLNRPIHSRKELDHFHEDNKFLLLSEGRPNTMRYLKLSPRI